MLTAARPSYQKPRIAWADLNPIEQVMLDVFYRLLLQRASETLRKYGAVPFHPTKVGPTDEVLAFCILDRLRVVIW